jgi:hypothetical protein
VRISSVAELILVGSGVGALMAVCATCMLRSFLYQVDLHDCAVIVAATVSIILLTAASSVCPARHVASVLAHAGPEI